MKNKLFRCGGLELANDLWKTWGLEGSFESYILNRISNLYRQIKIDHPSARKRAFKSLYYLPRWSCINYSIFKELGEIVVPYGSNEMCKFICTVPERLLKERLIQRKYIIQNCPEAASIPLQKYYPLNLFLNINLFFLLFFLNL